MSASHPAIVLQQRRPRLGESAPRCRLLPSHAVHHRDHRKRIDLGARHHAAGWKQLIELGPHRVALLSRQRLQPPPQLGGARGQGHVLGVHPSQRGQRLPRAIDGGERVQHRDHSRISSQLWYISQRAIGREKGRTLGVLHRLADRGARSRQRVAPFAGCG